MDAYHRIVALVFVVVGCEATADPEAIDRPQFRSEDEGGEEEPAEPPEPDLPVEIVSVSTVELEDQEHLVLTVTCSDAVIAQYGATKYTSEAGEEGRIFLIPIEPPTNDLPVRIEVTLRSSAEADAKPVAVVESYVAPGESVHVISKAEYRELLAELTIESAASIDQEQVASVIELMNADSEVPMVLAGVTLAGPAVAEETAHE